MKMERENKHYYTEFPDADVKVHSITASLRKHLYMFKTLPGVFSYEKIDLGTNVLIENIIFPKEKNTILDLGCGYGVIGIVIAREIDDCYVYFIDSNKRALWCTHENIKINLPNQIKRVKVLYGNYFEPLNDKILKFNGIYMNPPMRRGRREFLNLCQVIPSFLNIGGFFQFVIRRKMGAEYILKYLQENNTKNIIEVVCKRSGYWVFNYIRME